MQTRHVNIWPPVTALFKGRRSILERLSAYFSARSSGNHRRLEFLLHDLDSSGKIPIALKFADQCENQ
jgi:hypothetical protein